jgi:hypothetical protein
MLPPSGDKQVVYHQQQIFAASTTARVTNNLKLYIGPDQKLGTR